MFISKELKLDITYLGHRSNNLWKKYMETQKTQTECGKQAEVEKTVVDIKQYAKYFRELDIEVFNILNSGLITKAALDTEMNTKDETVVQLQPAQLLFLLEDLTLKLEHVLPASASKRRTFLKTKGDKKSGFCHLDQLGAHAIAKKASKLLPVLCNHLEATSAFFQAQIAANDGMVDGPGSNSEESVQMAACFHLLLQCLHAITAWNGFLMHDQRPLLREVLGVLAGRMSETRATQGSLQDLVKQSFHYLENFSGATPNLHSAVTLCRLLVVMAEKSDSNELGEKIGALSKTFLQREWLDVNGERLKGAKNNELVQQLLKMYFFHTDEVLNALEHVAGQGVSELLQEDKNGCSRSYPTLTRNSFSVFYKCMLNELVDCAKGFPVCKDNSPLEHKLETLIRWNKAVRVFHILVNLIKSYDARSNLLTVFKCGRQFVEVFLRLGMPLLDMMFRNHRDDVSSLLKNLQLSTRYLHHMCGHSKIIKDIALTNQVPLLKKCLEAFVYRVKAMLTLNKCLEAFWLGNLKNRDLQGEEIVSQSSIADESSREDGSDNESLVEEDDDSDVEVESKGSNDKDESDGEESYSETY